MGKLRASGQGHFGSVSSLVVDGRNIVTGARDASLKVWARDGSCKRTLRGHELSVNALALAGRAGGRDGRVLSGGGDGSVRLWDYVDGRCSRIMYHGAPITCLSWPVAPVAVSGASDGSMMVWTLADGKCCGRLKGHTAGVTVVQAGPAHFGSHSILSASKDGTVRRWKLPSVLG